MENVSSLKGYNNIQIGKYYYIIICGVAGSNLSYGDSESI
jgi:hypothetical protein